MPSHLRLFHKLVGPHHVFTSPDLEGLHVTADTEADAQRAVIAMVHAIADELGSAPPVVVFAEAAAAA